MDGSLSQSRRTFDTPSYYAGVSNSQLTESNATLERAHRLYAIGELAAAARLLSKLAAGRDKAEGRRAATDG